jgi:ABC-2 type transport system ATP-binding protein
VASVPQPKFAAPVEAPKQDGVELVAAAITSLVDDTPALPVEPPATLPLLAAATRRETSDTPPTANSVANSLTTNALTTNAVDAIDPATVVGIPQTAPLEFLQHIPIVGQLIVTPIVAFIHAIPVVGDVLHQFVGYPVQLGAAPGTPVARDVRVISFDGTQIYTHFMPALVFGPDKKAPTIVYGPGLGMPGATSLYGTPLDGVLTDLFGFMSIATLRQAGYNVVTWDPRGEWGSGGELQTDHPDFEGQDASAIISWVSQQAEVRLDAPGDPQMGMVGGSYGGGVQLVTAARDHRVDAIVPTIAWNSLQSTLYKNQAVKTSWGLLLTGILAGTLSRSNPLIYQMAVTDALTGSLTQADRDFLAARGPDFLLKDITAPTLLIQGTVDTLFSLDEADANAEALIANGVPTKVLWFCGGHGLCANNLLDGSDGVMIAQRTLEWLDKYVKREDVETGPQFEWVDQHGQWFSSDRYPVEPGPVVIASTDSGGFLPIVPVVGGSLGIIGGYRAPNALNLTVPAASTTTHIVGAPQLTLTYSGNGIARHVYAQLIDDSTGLALGSQVTPIPVTLDGQSHTLTISLEQVAATLAPGQTVTLQLVASTGTYLSQYSFGTLNVSSMQLGLPTAPDAVAESPQQPIMA